jgi:hypothetical protein
VFDNIPLTALALRQGGYDWGFLAYAVGFGGSMIWFGSSAGVALASQFAEARSAKAWLSRAGTVAVAYVLGFAVLLAVLGWHPIRRARRAARRRGDCHAPALYRERVRATPDSGRPPSVMDDAVGRIRRVNPPRRLEARRLCLR